MSDRFEFTQILSGSLRMRHRNILMWKARRNELPEVSPIDAFDAILLGDRDACSELKSFEWYGEGARWMFEETFPMFVADLEGEADILIVWGGGSRFTGIRIKDGRFVSHEIIMKLGDPLP